MDGVKSSRCDQPLQSEALEFQHLEALLFESIARPMNTTHQLSNGMSKSMFNDVE